MIEKPDDKTINDIISLKKVVIRDNKPLLVWAQTIRNRAIMQF